MMNQQINEIPLSNKTERKYIALVVGLLVFLLSVIIIGALHVGDTFFSIHQTRQLTIQIPMDHLTVLKTQKVVVKNHETEEEQESKFEEKAPISADDLYIKVTEFLKKNPNVLKYEKVSPENMQKSYQRWHDKNHAFKSFPLLVDVVFHKNIPVDLQTFYDGLYEIHDRISIQFNERWTNMLSLLTHVLKVISYLFMGLILFCLITLTTLILRASLKAHFSIIEVIKYMGAKDSYIIRLYQKHIFVSLFMGSVSGVIMAVPVIYLFFMACSYFGLPVTSFTIMAWDHLKILISLPFFVTLIGILSTRIAVNKSLKNIH
ncbi:MAG: hypothetical protein NEHIOOID_01007 [Holosporales bacterium]